MEERITTWRPWLVVGILTILWHLLFFAVPWSELFPSHAPKSPAKIDIQSISPKQLESIRDQWKKQKGLLLSKDNAPSAKEAPTDARYISDKNRKVEKEQRAARTNVIPKAGSASQPKTPPQSRVEKTQPDRKASPLAHLGVPLHLTHTPPKPPTPPRPAQPEEEGGDQALHDRNLPQGSENMLNTQQSIYYSFYARVYEAIGPVWQSRIREVPYSRRVAPGDYTTQVEVLFDRAGNIADIRYHLRSGIPEFDKAVESSWKRIGKFPNPPSALIEADGTVHTAWTFTVEVGQDFNLQYLPPKRDY